MKRTNNAKGQIPAYKGPPESQGSGKIASIPMGGPEECFAESVQPVTTASPSVLVRPHYDGPASKLPVPLGRKEGQVPETQGDAGQSNAGGRIESENNCEWTVVGLTRRQIRAMKKDRKSILIWGMSPDIPEQAIYGLFCLPTGSCIRRELLDELKWMEHGASRFVSLTMTSSVTRDACFDKVSKFCEVRGWRAVKSRSYSKRAQQRGTTYSKQPPLPDGRAKRTRPIENYFAPLSEPSSPKGSDEEAEEQLSLDAPPRVDFSPQVWSRLFLGSFNLQGHLAAKIAELETYVESQRYDIVALQEVRNVKTISVKGYKYFSHVQGSGQGGVGFLIALHLFPLATKLSSPIPNQLWMKLRGTAGHKDLYVCSAYMPQESAPVIERTTAWGELTDRVGVLQTQGEEVVIAGDLNAKVGKPRTEAERETLGPFTVGTFTRNGQLLLDMLMSQGMVNTAGFARPPNVKLGWGTRLDPATCRSSQIDYILVSSAQHHRHDAKFAVDETSLDSDHYLVGASVYFSRRLPKRKRDRKITRFLVEKLRERAPEGGNEDITVPADKYREEVEKSFGDSYDPSTVASEIEGGNEMRSGHVVKDFINKMNTALEASVGSKTVSKRYSRSWFDADVRKAIDERRSAHGDFKSSRSQHHWKKFKTLRGAVRRLIRMKKKDSWEKLVTSIQEDSHRDPKQMWTKMKRIIGTRGGKSNNSAVLREDGTLAFTTRDKKETWATYQAKLTSHSEDPSFDAQFKADTDELVSGLATSAQVPTSESSKLDEDFTDDDLRMALDQLKYYKASSFDEVRNESLKEGGTELRSNLLKLFNWINSTEDVPSDWARSLVVNLYKDGDEHNPGNYRGISLISCLGKLYLSMWNRRITQHLDPRLAEEQGGFRNHRSTVDQIFTLNEVLLRRRRAGQSTYCFFIDFRKAFDTVWHTGLWKRLWENGIRGKAWRILRSLYSQLESSVLVDGEHTRFVPSEQGVRQGCPLSPILFSCYINDLVDRLKTIGGGSLIGDRDICSLLYADDIVLIAESAERLQLMIDEVAQFTAEWRLSLNPSKSKVMVVRPNGRSAVRDDSDSDDSDGDSDSGDSDRADPVMGDLDSDNPDRDEPDGGDSTEEWTFRGRPLEVVHKYKYLGLLFTDKLLWDQHIAMVIGKGKQGLRPLRRLFAQRQLPLLIKKLAYMSLLRSKLEHGSQVWCSTTTQEAQLESIQHTAATWILRVNQKASCTALRTILGLPCLSARRDMMRLFYVGLLLSKTAATWPRHCLEVVPSSENRVIGRSQTHWLSYFQALTGTSEDLETAYRTLTSYLAGNDGVLPLAVAKRNSEGKTLIVHPVADWRQAVRKFIDCRELQRLRDESMTRPTLAVLRAAAITSLSDRTSVLLCTPSHANWIRIRLLCGTSALNVTMAKMTRSTRSPYCPMCLNQEETVLHFLRECSDPSFVRARADHEVHMPSLFRTLSPLQQCAFILGCSVSEVSDPNTSRKAGEGEDTVNVKLIEELYGLRSVKLTQAAAGDFDPSDAESSDELSFDAAASSAAGLSGDDAAGGRGRQTTLIGLWREARSSRAHAREGVEAHGGNAQLRI